MTYIIHADYQPLNYIISGVDSSQIKEICLKDIKDTLLLRCVRGLLRRLGLYWVFRSLYIRSESLEQLSLIEENARIIIIDNRHLVDLRIIDKILPSSVERNLFYWTPICQLFHRYTSEKRSKYMKAISKMYRISSFNADDARIYPEIAIKPPFFRFPNKSKLTSDVTQGLYFIGYEKNRRDVLLEYKASFGKAGLAVLIPNIQKKNERYILFRKYTECEPVQLCRRYNNRTDRYLLKAFGSSIF